MRWVGWSQSEMQKFRIERATERAVVAAHECNRYLQEQAPWAKDVSEERRQIVVRSALEAAYILAHLLEPVREENKNKALLRTYQRVPFASERCCVPSVEVGRLMAS